MIRVKGWTNFQHYNDRKPPWIKLHRELLENYNWFCLQHASKALAICIWLLACENEDPKSGLVTDDPRVLAFRARMTELEVIESVKDLIRHGFIEHIKTDASDLLAPCYQDATSETETERENTNTKRAREKSASREEKIEALSLNDISGWLAEKRANGRYLTIDEQALLEMFKDYCRAKKPKYVDFVAAFRNAFNWENAPTKGNKHGVSSPASKTDRAKASLRRSCEALGITGEQGVATATDQHDLSVFPVTEGLR